MKAHHSPAPLELVKLCARALDEKKAEDLRVLDVSAQSSITDYLVLATGNSEPHLRALRVELEKVIDASGTHIVGMELAQESGWLVVDAFNVMVHLFTSEQRRKYQLERLWKDAVEISIPSLLAVPQVAAPKAPKKAPAKKAAPKKTPAKAAGKKAKRKN
jgi:ribosome-associated protein